MDKTIMINGERVYIRQYQLADWKDTYEYLSDENVVKYEPYNPLTKEQVKKEVEKRVGTDNFYAVCLNENHKLIGNIYFSKEAFDTYELGYVFNASYQHQGYATEACELLIDYMIDKKNVHRIVANCNPENIASWRLLERLGMRREGYFKQNVYFEVDENDKPIYIDTYQYAILKEEWRGNSKWD